MRKIICTLNIALIKSFKITMLREREKGKCVLEEGLTGEEVGKSANFSSCIVGSYKKILN